MSVFIFVRLNNNDNKRINKTLLKIFVIFNLECLCAAFFFFLLFSLSMMNYSPLVFFSFSILTITVHQFVPTINHYQFSNLFLRPLVVYITYIHIDTCVWCEITLRVYECVYTLSKGNKRQKEKDNWKEGEALYIYTYYYNGSMRVSE
jgi:Trk-type K+ transport system membrane component